MKGDRIKALKESMLALATGDATTSGRFSTFRARERILITPFSDEIHPTLTFDLTESPKQNAPILAEFSQQISSLQAGGGTAIFSAVASVYEDAQAAMKKGDRHVSIILETDGENRNGISLNALREFVEQRGEPRVPIFAILYGDGQPEEMRALASMSRGRVFDAKKVKLSRVMKDIRTYQ